MAPADLPPGFRLRGTLHPLVLPGFVFGILAGAIVLTWLYEGAGCSLLLVALWHTSFNLGSATRAGEGVIAPLVTVFVIVSAFVIARGWRRSDQEAAWSPCRPAAPRSLNALHAGTGGQGR